MDSDISTGAKPNIFSNIDPKDLLAKDIFDLMGTQNMSEEKKAQLYSEMLESIQIRVITRIYQTLNETDKTKWDELAKNNNTSNMEAFLHERNIDVAKIFAEESLLYKAEMVKLSQKLK